jgi:hypothetical protein
MAVSLQRGFAAIHGRECGVGGTPASWGKLLGCDEFATIPA